MESKIKKILSRYLQGNANVKEQEFLDNWCEKMTSVDCNLTKEELQRIELRLSSKIAVKKRRVINQGRAKVFSLVCVFILLPVFGVLLYNQNSKITLEYYSDTDKQNIILPDNTKVTLFKGSSLIVDQEFNSQNRKVYLHGEAFFDVTKDSAVAFIVDSQHLTTKVLGTSFVVKDSDSLYKVVVETGRVSVKTNHNNNLYILNPLDSIAWNQSHIVTNTLVDNHSSFNFKGKNLQEVTKELSQYFQVQIQLDQLVDSSVVLHSNYPITELNEILNSLCFVLDLQQNNLNNIILIQPKN